MKLRNKKTGDIWEFDLISMKIADTTLEKLKARGCSGSCCARSLSELNEEWEDYKPSEPLIKDEKIRKALRAWAEVNGIDEVAYVARSNSFGRFGYSIRFAYEFVLNDGLEDVRFYTIAELCGEEEE